MTHSDSNQIYPITLPQWIVDLEYIQFVVEPEREPPSHGRVYANLLAGTMLQAPIDWKAPSLANT